MLRKKKEDGSYNRRNNTTDKAKKALLPNLSLCRKSDYAPKLGGIYFCYFFQSVELSVELLLLFFSISNSRQSTLKLDFICARLLSQIVDCAYSILQVLSSRVDFSNAIIKTYVAWLCDDIAEDRWPAVFRNDET